MSGPEFPPSDEREKHLDEGNKQCTVEKKEERNFTPKKVEGTDDPKKAEEILNEELKKLPEDTGTTDKKSEETGFSKLDFIKEWFGAFGPLLDGLWKNIRGLLTSWGVKGFEFDLNELDPPPDDYDDDKYDKYDVGTRDNIKYYKEKSSALFESVFDSVLAQKKDQLTSANIDEFLDAYQTELKTQWEGKKRKVEEKDYQSIITRINGFKEAFKDADSDTQEKIIQWAKEDKLSAGLLGKETIEAVDKNIDPETMTLLTSPEGQRYARYLESIVLVGAEHKVPTSVIVQLLIKEFSRGNPFAQSPGGAFGLTQMLKGTWEENKPHNGDHKADRHAPHDQIWAGINYLKKLYREFGSWSKAMVRYNTGPGGPSKWKDFESTKNGNPAIADRMQPKNPKGYPNTPDGYDQAAEDFYSEGFPGGKVALNRATTMESTKTA